MHKSILFILSFVILISTVACGNNTTKEKSTGDMYSTMYEASGLEEKYWNSYANCISYIENNFPNSEIDLQTVSVLTLKEEEKESVFIVVEGVKDYFANSEDKHWKFTIGDTSGHNFCILICNSENNDVIGYIPIE